MGWHWRAHDQGANSPRAIHNEDQGRGTARAQILRVDRRLHPFLAEHLPADVDPRASTMSPALPSCTGSASDAVDKAIAFFLAWRCTCRMDEGSSQHSKVHAHSPACAHSMSHTYQWLILGIARE